MRKGHRAGSVYASECVVLNTAAVVVGAVLICAGLLATVVGYDYYVTMKEADEHLQDQLDEQGLSEIPGLDDFGDRAKAGLAAPVAGIVMALAGGVLLAYGLLTKPEDATSRLNLFPGTANFCSCCGRHIVQDAAWCPSCGRKF